MTKFVEIAVTVVRNILVEVADDSDKSLNLVYDLASNFIAGDIDHAEIVEIYDSVPHKF